MTTDRPVTSRLFTTSVIEGRIDLDEKYDKAYNNVINLTRGLSEEESHHELNKALDDRKAHDELCLGLLVSILADPSVASRHYHDLTLVSRDSLKVVTETLIHQIIGERFSRLSDNTRKQLLWLVRELVKTGINNVEGVVWCLLRQIAGGDVSQRNAWLAESLVDILRENRPWLDKFPVIVASVAYTYLRILEDHHGPQFAVLRQKEVMFVVGLLRERFSDCLMIGRDLVRLLQNIAKIPEIEAFWRDMIHNPASLCSTFTGVLQLLQMRTSRRFFVVRLTPEMEKKMVFLCTDVKFGMQKRYQEWFQKQYLNTPESQTLRCDLIRFIIGCIHPSNEVLCSDIIPRWAVIGWLLSSCTSPVATANCKLALFYDWLVYNTETDNIMNIEPGILVMYHSMRPHPVLTTSLLDFICRIIPHFHPPLADKVRGGLHNSLRQILEKRVIQALEPLFDNPRMDVELRKLIKETFPQFCSATAVTDVKPEDFVSAVSSTTSVTRMDLMAETGLDFATSSVPESVVNNNNHSEDENEAMFSDEEEEVQTQKVTPVAVPPIKEEETPVATGPALPAVEVKKVISSVAQEDKVDLSKHLEFLETDMRNIIIDLQNESDTQQRCYFLQKVCDLILSEDLDQDEALNLASCLCHLLDDDLSPGTSLLPQDITSESIQESLGRPLYVLFDNLITLPEDDHRRQPLLQLLVEMHKVTNHVGYIFLYFLKASTVKADKEDEKDDRTFLTYRDLCKASGLKDFAGFIIRDLTCCSENDSRVLSWIIPDIYNSFPKQTRGNSDILQIVVERLDSTQLHDLVCMVLQGSLQMFDNSAFANILEKSLQWETVEQLFLWQLAKAHEVPVDCCLSVMPKLKFTSHSATVNNTHGEALSNILMMLRRESPSEILLRTLLLREFRLEDPTVATILQYWVQRYEDKMAKLINDVVNNKPQPSPNKRKRNQMGKSCSVPLDQVLSHLNHLRTACGQTTFFTLQTMQDALQTAQNQCSESQKKKFSDLFALIEEEEEEEPAPEPQRKPKSNRGRKPKSRKKQESESEEESSEGPKNGMKVDINKKSEEDVKKPARKRKKNNQVGSDSD